MRLGIVRHFKVKVKPGKGWLSADEFKTAMDNYDCADVIPNSINISACHWEICYCSTLPRAIKTAQTIFAGKIIQTDLLREVPIHPFIRNNSIKFPSFIWHIGSRIAWVNNMKSQSEGKGLTKIRIKNFLALIENQSSENVLIVSHGFFIGTLFRELKKMGFSGESDIRIPNGKLYIWNK